MNNLTPEAKEVFDAAMLLVNKENSEKISKAIEREQISRGRPVDIRQLEKILIKYKTI